jgi:nucleoside-diphosphate-sugar epimerase
MMNTVGCAKARILTHNHVMRRLLIIGCGDIALRAIPLLKKSYRVFALVRDPTKCAGLRALGVQPLLGDLDNRASLARIVGLADAVLHFAPPAPTPPLTAEGSLRSNGVPTGGVNSAQPLAGGGLPTFGVPLAGVRGGREGFDVDTRTRNLLSALSKSKLPVHLVYISTSGVYGDCAGAWVSETHPLNATSSRARLRVDAEMQIRAWAKRNHVHASILRVPGIYAADRLPLSRLQQGTPGIVDSEDSYTNHIHADDLARISVAALQYGKSCRVYHSSDDSHLKMGEYFDLVADVYNLPRVPRISRAEAQRVLSPMMLSFMNESRRLTNTRMKQELKVVLRYPTVADGLKAAR